MRIKLKKNIFVTFMILFAGSTIFAQNALSGNLRTGAYVSCSPVIGEMSENFFGNVGGGIACEYDVLQIFGVGVNTGVNSNPIKTEKLTSCWSLDAMALIYARIPLLQEQLFIQPELGYGLSLYFPEKAEEYNGELSSCYADQFVQIELSVRYAPSFLLNGALEFELSPYYRFSPENGVMNHFAGGKAGVYYRF